MSKSSRWTLSQRNRWANRCKKQVENFAEHKAKQKEKEGPVGVPEAVPLDPAACRVLGIEQTATFLQVKNAFRRACCLWHPDRNSSPEAPERFTQVVAAYDLLHDRRRSRRDGY